MKYLFYKPSVFNSSEDKFVFWSDTHFGHKCEHWEYPLWKVRGFSSVAEHDETLIKRWNLVSTQESIFFMLGDFMFGFDTINRFKTTIDRLNFRTLYIMPGNHCSGWKQNFEQQNLNVWYTPSNKQVVFVPNYFEIIINKQPIVLSHYPLASFNGQGKGSWMLHGHCHGNLIKSAIGPLLYKTKTKEISVEICPNPITFTELKNELDKRPILTYDHHNQNTKNPF